MGPWGGVTHEQVKAFERRCRHLYGASPAVKRKRAVEEAALEAAGIADSCGGFLFAGEGCCFEHALFVIILLSCSRGPSLVRCLCQVTIPALKWDPALQYVGMVQYSGTL